MLWVMGLTAEPGRSQPNSVKAGEIICRSSSSRAHVVRLAARPPDRDRILSKVAFSSPVPPPIIRLVARVRSDVTSLFRAS